MSLYRRIKKNKKTSFIGKFDRKMKKYKIYLLIKEVTQILSKREIGLLPSYIAYFVLLSFIPIASLIFNIISIIINGNDNSISLLSEILPNNIYGITVLLLEHNTRGWQFLTLANITLLFLASRIYSAFYRSYLIIYNTEVRGLFIRDKIFSLINTILLIVLIFILTIFTVLNTYVYNYLSKYIINLNINIINYLHLIFSIIIINVVVTFLMFSIPDIRQSIKDVFLGSIFVTLGWILASFIFKMYVENYANYQTVYKTFAAVIVFVTWIYLLCYILIIGIAVNKANLKITSNEKY